MTLESERVTGVMSRVNKKGRQVKFYARGFTRGKGTKTRKQKSLIFALPLRRVAKGCTPLKLSILDSNCNIIPLKNI